MRGVILAGGTGSRLAPLTRVTNKALLPVGSVPLIFHHLYLLKDAGIDDIMIVTGPECAGDLMRVLGSGAAEGVKLTYRIQDAANGIAAAMLMADDFVRNQAFVVLLGDNLFFPHEQMASAIRDFGQVSDGSVSRLGVRPSFRLFAKKVPDPQRFGVCCLDASGNVYDIVEKPDQPPSQLAVVGCYCYTPKAITIAAALTPSARGEYEITDVNRRLLRDYAGDVVEVKADWVDAGTHASLRRANELAWREEALK